MQQSTAQNILLGFAGYNDSLRLTDENDPSKAVGGLTEPCSAPWAIIGRDGKT